MNSPSCLTVFTSCALPSCALRSHRSWVHRKKEWKTEIRPRRVCTSCLSCFSCPSFTHLSSLYLPLCWCSFLSAPFCKHFTIQKAEKQRCSSFTFFQLKIKREKKGKERTDKRWRGRRHIREVVWRERRAMCTHIHRWSHTRFKSHPADEKKKNIRRSWRRRRVWRANSHVCS